MAARESPYVTAGEAVKILHTTRMKISTLMRDGVLVYKEDPLDKRRKLILRSDVEKLRDEWRPELSPVA